MKRQISLKLYVALAFLFLIILLVIGYSILSIHFFIRGMDNATFGTMDQTMTSYIKTVPAAQRLRLNNFSGYQIAPTWQQMPHNIRSKFSKPDRDNYMFKYDDSGWFQHPEQLIFLMRFAYDHGHYYVSRTIQREQSFFLRQDGEPHGDHFLRSLITLSISVALIMSFLVWLLFKQVSRPISALGSWARQLDEHNLQQSPPDFSYPELNELAVLIRSSLSSVQQSLQREQRFLRHSSHELRTPIAIIRNNLELLYKIQRKLAAPPDPRQAQIVARIDRASLTMKHLTETLLWLSRQSTDKLPGQEFDLQQLLDELVAEQRYLLKNKKVALRIQTAAYQLNAPLTPARIVLGNLIRNAFQHSWQGEISISQQHNRIEISNSLAADAENSHDLGFGLGLELTEQLTARMGWTCQKRTTANQHVVVVELC
ncbi:sensor histidine kinase [Pelobacter seleniigenes]|uniref:sensor histidine kinase n=1 Tax=Pelobacter seleniigenes TaxID=407188 RepID=UPI0004A6DD64|nr:HAMP domain-containing sensor histidine kinase [Pelobacter seleniigenes]